MTHSSINDARIDRFARRVAARLDDAAADVPHDVSERLRVARQQALARRKVAPRASAAVMLPMGGAAALTLGGRPGGPQGDDRFGWGFRIASVLPMVALLAGLVVISQHVDDGRARELAEVDAKILVDDLPPSAYADPGFLQFLKSDGQPE